jgi:hypothetical protein
VISELTKIYVDNWITRTLPVRVLSHMELGRRAGLAKKSPNENFGHEFAVVSVAPKFSNRLFLRVTDGNRLLGIAFHKPSRLHDKSAHAP